MIIHIDNDIPVTSIAVKENIRYINHKDSHFYLLFHYIPFSNVFFTQYHNDYS